MWNYNLTKNLYGYSWQLQFLQSEFRGQLPQPYRVGPNSTAFIPEHMNDMNEEEPTRYVSLNLQVT